MSSNEFFSKNCKISVTPPNNSLKLPSKTI